MRTLNSDEEKVDEEKVGPKEEELLLEKVGSKPSKEEEIKEEYTLLKNNGGKITIKVLKDLLQRLNIKSSGKKEELQDRIENLINA